MIGKLPPKLLTENEELLAEFHPHWKVMFLSVFTAVGAGILTVLVVWGFDSAAWRPAVLVALWIAVAGTFVVDIVRRVSTTYALTSHRLIWRWGVFRRRGVEIPLEQINTVSFSQGVIERAFGFGDVEIESASANGTSRFENIPDPQVFQSRIYTARNTYTDNKMTRGFASATEARTDQPPPQDRWEQLSRLGEMYSAGQLTDDEFASAKASLLVPPDQQSSHEGPPPAPTHGNPA